MQPKYYGAAAEYNKAPLGGGFNLSPRIFLFVGLGVGVLALIFIAFSVLTSLSKGPQDDFAKLVARENGLSQLIDKQKTGIKNSELRTVAVSASLLVAGDAALITKQLTSVFGLEGVPETIAASEADLASEAELKKAALAGTFDKTFLALLRDKVAANYSLAESVAKNASATSVKASTQQILNNLFAIDEQLTKIQL